MAICAPADTASALECQRKRSLLPDRRALEELRADKWRPERSELGFLAEVMERVLDQLLQDELRPPQYRRYEDGENQGRTSGIVDASERERIARSATSRNARVGVRSSPVRSRVLLPKRRPKSKATKSTVERYGWHLQQ